MGVLLRAAPTALGKVRARIYSNRLALMIGTDPRRAPAVDPMIDVVVRREPSSGLREIEDTLRQASGGDLLFLRGLERMRLRDPGDAYVARLPDGEIAASIFVHDVPARDRLERAAPGIYPPIADDEVLTEGMYCWPRFRGLGIPAHLISRTLQFLAPMGIARALAVVETSNPPSLRAFARAGYEPNGVIRRGTYRLNRWQSTFEEDAALAERMWNECVGPVTSP
jgi:RimJ/RimL family protein N-acetyltransferase